MSLLGVTPVDSFFQFMANTFDASISEVFGALCAGAALLVWRPPDFVTAIVTGRPSVLFMTPAALSALRPGSLPRLRVLMTCGEPLSLELARAWRPYADSIANVYGAAPLCPAWHVLRLAWPRMYCVIVRGHALLAPALRAHARILGQVVPRRSRKPQTLTPPRIQGPTEATIISHVKLWPRGAPMDAITIGPPLPATTCYVLDVSRRLAPAGAVGTLWIGGAGVGPAVRCATLAGGLGLRRADSSW